MLYANRPGCPTFLRFLAVPKKASILSEDSYTASLQKPICFWTEALAGL
jgi:hypothetical protein